MKLTGGLGKLGGLGGMKLGGLTSKPAATVADPLEGVEYTGNEETDTKVELNAMQLAFRARKAREAERYDNATDTEFWTCIVFRTRAQKESFLKAAGLIELGDKYLDGEQVAKALKIKLE